MKRKPRQKAFPMDALTIIKSLVRIVDFLGPGAGHIELSEDMIGEWNNTMMLARRYIVERETEKALLETENKQ